MADVIDKKVFRLGSAPMLNTPGILKWGMEKYHFKGDRKRILNVFISGWPHEDNPANPTKEQFDKLLKAEIPYTIEPGEFGETVVFTA